MKKENMKGDNNTKTVKEKPDKIANKNIPKAFSIRDDESESNFDTVAKTTFMKHKRL